MVANINVLFVEDSEDDTLLQVRRLKKGGFDVHYDRVFTQHDLDKALRDRRWDIVISDHNMPNFSSELALQTIGRFDRDLPVIIVSGAIGEELAVEAMRNGAHDYIMKENLVRLLPAVERELREADNRRSQREAERKIHYMANHDALTGLMNRFGFEKKLIDLLDSVAYGQKHAFLYIDLDQFKIVNDTSGHVAGDELLRQLAVVLEKEIRGNDTIARLGGDEFGVLLDNCPLGIAENIAEDMIRAVKAFHFTWKARTFTLGASVGLVVIDEQYHDPDEVMSAADMACYKAKDSGRNRLFTYRPDDRDLAQRQVEMEWVTRIRVAIEDDRFRLYRQRILPLNSWYENMKCFEFLLRVLEKDGRYVMPGVFIPAAERYDLMPEIDRWVVDRAMSVISAMDRNCVVLAFVNLSGSTLDDADRMMSYIREKIEQYQVLPRYLCFEITETAAISNFGAAVEFIREIRELGCRFALDDFGAGMSSFSYLKALPVDFIKIDGEFVRNMDSDDMSRAIVEALNNIAHVAGLKTIGEYAESEQILHNLEALGVDFAQGYGIEKPVEI